jgi:tetratricopeptide (TPR) repeat protein
VNTRLIGILLFLGLTCLGGCATRPIESMRTNGDFHFEHGRYDQASQEYAGIIARAPGDWQAQSRYGQSMLKLGDLNAARRALETAYSRNPLDDETARGLAETLLAQGDNARLYQFLKDRAGSLRSVDAYLDMADYCREMGDFDSARFAANTAIMVDNGKRSEPYVKASQLAAELGNHDEAMIRIRQAYGVNPQDRRVLAMIAEMGEVPGPTFALPPGNEVAGLDVEPK